MTQSGRRADAVRTFTDRLAERCGSSLLRDSHPRVGRADLGSAVAAVLLQRGVDAMIGGLSV